MRRQYAVRDGLSVPDKLTAEMHLGAEALELSTGERGLRASAQQGRSRQPNEGLRALFERVADPLFVVSIEASKRFHLEEFNPTFARLFGISSPRRASPHQLLPATVAERFTNTLVRCRRSKGPVHLRMSLATIRGVAHYEFLLTPVIGLLGRVEWITGHGRVGSAGQGPGDDQAGVQECIARITRDLFYAFDASAARGLFLNARVQDVLGYEVDELRDMMPEELKALIHPADRLRVMAHYRKLDTAPPGAVIPIEFRVRHASGRYVWLACKDTVLISERDRSRKVVGCATDTSDQRHALAEVKKISRQLLRTQDEERRRIARELHDSTSQHLVAIGIGLARLGMINQRAPDARLDRKDVQEIIAGARRSTTEAQKEIRALSYLLHPPALERMGLCQTLRRFSVGFARRTRICVDIAIPEDLVCRSNDIATAFLRIAQEALLNVYRHAEASKVAIRLMKSNGRLTLEVEDDGKGIGRASAAHVEEIETIGVGIPGMRARVRQFRGELEVLSRDSGVLVRATIPESARSLD